MKIIQIVSIIWSKRDSLNLFLTLTASNIPIYSVRPLCDLPFIC